MAYKKALILSVQARPRLWDKSHPDLKDSRIVKPSNWQDVVEDVYATCKIAQRFFRLALNALVLSGWVVAIRPRFAHAVTARKGSRVAGA